MRHRLFVLLLLPLLLGADLQPEPRGDVAPDRLVDIQHLRLELTVDLDAGRVAGAAIHTVRLLQADARRLAFHQAGLAFERVLFDGQEVPFRAGHEQVMVTLPEGLTRGAEGELRFEYSAQPTSGLHFRRPGEQSPDDYLEVWSQGEGTDNRHWFPTFDHPGDRFTYEGIYTAPDPLVVVSGGALVGKEPAEAGWTRWHYRLDQELVSYLVSLAVGPYERYDAAWGDVPLETYAPPHTDEATALRTTGRVGEMMELFEQFTGLPYPWPVYRQTFVQRFMYSGMENTSATTMHRRLLFPERVQAHRTDAASIVAHELAHQWYGDLLTCRTWREMWLNEGFATYLTGLWNGADRGSEHAAVSAWGRYRGVTGADDRSPLVLVKRFWGRSLGRADPYGKGASVLRMLRVMLGDEAFLAGIARYTRDNRNGLVETQDLRRAMEDESGMRLDWFFDQWVYLPGHPKLAVSHRVEDEGARLRVELKQTQDTSGLVPVFTLPIDLEIATSKGTRVERIWMGSAEASATFELDGELRWVAVDPRGGLLAVLEHDLGPDERAAWLLGTEEPYGRAQAFRALRALDGVPTEAERAAVVGFLRDEAGPLTWRVEAARVLGAWRDEASTEVLLEVLAAERDRGDARSTPLIATLCGELGAGLARPGVVAALDRSLTREPVEYVQAEALKALGELLEGGARGRAITALRAGPTDQRILERGAADLLGRHGRASDLAALAPYRRMSVHRDLRNAALWASARIANREPVGFDRDAAREPVARDTERVLYDLDLRGRQTAVAILAQVGDARSIAELEALRRREQVTSLQEAAERAIDSIRRRQDRDPDPVDGELKARLERIEERLDAAEAELKELDERR